MFTRVMFAALLFLAAVWRVGALGAETWYVDGSVGQSGDGLTWQTAFRTIQEGINAASDGDSVTVAPATYHENIGFGGKNITLTSTNPLSSAIVSGTVIDGNRACPVISFSGTESENCVLAGFTIRDGEAYCGAGISGGTNAQRTHATIRDCTIVGNSAYWAGGGLAYCDGEISSSVIANNTAQCGGGAYYCDGTIEANLISENSAIAVWGDGGGLAFCDGTIRRNAITRNWAGDRGGGLADCQGTIQANTISDNEAWQGGGVYGCDGTVQNNLVITNHAEDVGGGLARCGLVVNNTVYGNSAGKAGGALYGCTGTVKNCIVWRNGAGEQLAGCSVPAYCCIENWSGGGQGNISFYPYFVNAANGHFHLKSWSPCVDAGDPSSPFSEELTPNGGRIDMGAYGNTPEATSKSPDTDGDQLPDKWELEFFGNLGQGRDDDADHDLVSNIQEYLRGSDPSAPATWHVDGSVDASGDGTLWERAFKTIQEGIDAASEGAVVIVAEHIYVENIHFDGKNITLTSTNPLDPEVVARTVIDGNGAGSVVKFDGTEGETCLLAGFTIRNGKAKFGAGICGGPWDNPTHARIENNIITENCAEENGRGYGGGIAYAGGIVRGNTITQNSAESYGGGLYYCRGTIQNNEISGNKATQGGGLFLCGPLIERNAFSGNSAADTGGGLYHSFGTVRRNRITENSAGSHGGGLANCEGVIQNNVICGNSGGGVIGGLYSSALVIESNTICNNSGGGLADCKGEIRNCIIWGNTGWEGVQFSGRSVPSYSCIGGWREGGEGNILYYPHFVDPANGDYHLKSWSPCIDAGDPASPFSEEPEPNGQRIDMGAYGNTEEATSKCPDSDRDGLADGWEVGFFGDLTYDATSDPDEDLVPNVNEYRWGLNPAFAVMWYVDGSVAASGDGMSWEGAFKTIKEGIQAASENEVVVVAKGVYLESVEFVGKNIVLRSTAPHEAAVVVTTVIDAHEWGTGVVFDGSEDEVCVLAGFTIRNAYGGIRGRVHTFQKPTHATIQNNVITGNLGSGVIECNGTIKNNVIVANVPHWSGGGLCWCDGEILNNVIARNVAEGSGGGLYGCAGKIENNTIWGNEAAYGAGLASCRGTIRNCIIWGNGGANQLHDCSLPEYSCLEGFGAAGEGNIPFEPYFADPENGDFHLSPFSPCIDAGDPASPFSDEPEPNGGRIDMGAYGNTPEATPKCPDADADGLPDGWEMNWFGNLQEDGAGDFDGDWVANVIEYRYGTDPTLRAEARVTNTTKGTWYFTIQNALSDSEEGDEIVVSPGVYLEHIDFGGRNVVLRSTDPEDETVRAQTVIDGGGSGSVVMFRGTEDERCLLAGFTIRNGKAEEGGGIFGGGCRARIENNIITANSADGGGGLHKCQGVIRNNLISENAASNIGGGLVFCNGMIENNTIRGNSAKYGGGLYDCDGLIENNIISQNTTTDGNTRGGGLCECDGTICENAISGNKAQWGGGLALCKGTIRNNRIYGNRARDGGGMDALAGTIENNTIYGNTADNIGGGLTGWGAIVRNCIIWGNACWQAPQICEECEATYSCIQDCEKGGVANISWFPYFADADAGDFHLKSWSPCIDAGDPSSDFSNEPQPNGGRIDMGAYGNTPEATPASNDADQDLLPDDWEMLFFGSLDHGPSDDPDGDGKPNLDEYRRARHPGWVGVLRYVDGSVASSGDGSSWQSAFKTVQEAIDAACDNDTITVGEGHYVENIHFHGKDITLTSINPDAPAVEANTVLDGGDAGPVVSFLGTEDESCVLCGFTVQNGKAVYGGGICGATMGGHTRATIRNNRIVQNRADGYGGGLYGCWGTIQNNAIGENSAEYGGGGLSWCNGTVHSNTIIGNSGIHYGGGGLYECDGVVCNNTIRANSGGGLYECDGKVHNNTITGNSAVHYGGGLGWCNGTIEDNVIARNTAGYEGGGLYGCDGTVQNNIIVGNTADHDGGGLASCRGTVQNNVITGNSASDYGAAFYRCQGTIRNNTIAGNSAFGCGLYECNGAIRNCVIWGKIGGCAPQMVDCALPEYSCIENWTGAGKGNTASDPQFVDLDGPDNLPETWEDNDYRLAPDSPCIDAGMNEDWMWRAVDFDGNPRIFFGKSSKTVDMGAYEYGSWPFRIVEVAAPSGAGSGLIWSSRVGETYVVWSCLDLLTGKWEEKATVPSQGEITTWTDADPTPRLRFYRIEAR